MPDLKLDFGNSWLYYQDKKGRMIYRADALTRLNKGRFSDRVTPHGILEFDLVYKFGSLKQIDYKVLLNPQDISVVGSGGVHRFSNSMRLEDVKIEFPTETVSLISYVNRKVSWVDMYTRIRQLSSKNSVAGKIHLKSYEISKLLSYENESIDKFNVIGGQKDIFESNELLDQLLISVLILHARWGHGHEVAIKLLSELLRDRIEESVKHQFKGYNNNDVVDLVDEAKVLAVTIIKNDKSLTRNNDVFKPSIKHSLEFFIVGPIVTKNTQKNKFVSKIQEHLEDRRDQIDKYKLVKHESEFKDINGDEMGESIFENKDPEFTESITKTDIDMILNKIPKDEANILSMYLVGTTLDEIGKMCHLQKSAVSKRLTKIRKKIRKYLE